MVADPTDCANLALDKAGIPIQLGDIEQGGSEANVCLRSYGECLRQLLRGAPWGFARRQTVLRLLADASGATPNVSTVVPGGQASKFCYEYAYPTDCARIRYIPGNQIAQPGIPAANIVPANNTLPLLATTPPIAPWGQRVVPTPFVLVNDPNFTSPPQSDASFQQGQSPLGNTTILSNVPNATMVFTFEAVYPSLWDQLFSGAMVAFLASEIALPLWTRRGKPDVGLKVQAAQITIAKSKVSEARIADGNEMTASSDIPVDWIRARRTGGGAYAYSFPGSGGNYGCWGQGWQGSLLFGDGAF
jgi:hypothetical protein